MIGKRGTEQGMDFPGYQRVPFPDFTFVVREDFVPVVGTLRQLLYGLVRNEVNSPEIKPFSSGRGVVYLARIGSRGEFIIRPYRHGGILGRVFKTRFFSYRRFLEELGLTLRARQAGVTLLEAVGVAYRKAGGGVHGFWITDRIPGAESLFTWMRAHNPSKRLIEEIARTIARMHQVGIGHVDLTIQNILVTHSSDLSPVVSVIDFDKAYYQENLDLHERMDQLRRLDRSLLKWMPDRSPWCLPWVRLRFACAYCRLAPKMRSFVKGYARNFRRYERWYRLGWALQGVKK